MNFPEIENAVKHLKETSKCLHCGGKYNMDNINLLATTTSEGLFEMKCPKCKNTTIVTVLITRNDPNKKGKADVPAIKEQNLLYRTHRKISQNDLLDVKNALNNFDGNFEKLFSKEKL